MNLFDKENFGITAWNNAKIILHGNNFTSDLLTSTNTYTRPVAPSCNYKRW